MRAHDPPMLFPFRHRSIFRSRWMALLWAAGVIWLALSVAAPWATTDTDDTAANASAQLTPEQQAALNAR
ncbi:hypothetical protein [Sphingomonas flavalba]|uniref:hypothetical protein n=1 Tax=Sphingomonas flavalba TaxID=2559804 RepID=UPI00109DD2D9|nr:hypothetical protein [Sphingomonas flavalba]